MGTKDRIIEKYIDLVLRRKTADISVTEICKETGISRKTFYSYFKDRLEVVESIFIDEIEKPMRYGFEISIDPEIVTTIMYRNFKKKKDFYIIAMKEEGKNTLFEDIIIRIQEFNIPVFQNKLSDSVDVEYLSYKFSATQAFMIKKWILGGMKESPERMAKLYYTNIVDIFQEKGNNL